MADPLVIPPAVQNALVAADRYFNAGDTARTIECLTVAAIVDIQANSAQLLNDPHFARQISASYARVFTALGMGGTFKAPPAADRSILFVAQCLAEGNAASANLVRMVRDHAANGWRVGVLIAEELSGRDPPLAHLHCPDGRAESVGAAFLRELRSHAEVMQVPINGTFLDGIEAGVNIARRWKPSIAVFIASPACPVQAGMAFARIAAAQVNLSIGVPLVIPGMDHIIYNNPAKLRADAAALSGVSVSSIETSGGDAEASSRAVPASRASLGVPDDAIVLITASNRLVGRLLSGSFADDLAAFLAEHPTAHWIGFGRGDLAALRQRMGTVADRVHLPGPVPDIRPAVRASDIYLNEYPEGGGNSVIEAMGCGTPVAAMNAGRSHGCNIGAALVGDDAIPTFDTAAYWKLVTDWDRDPDLRRAAGARQQSRAIEKLDYTVICAEYRRIFERLLRERQPAAA